ncbi:MAG: pyruvate kinase, partial [Rhodovibrionaceae bacterium]|nr:pyruvate kinase [Rhodovibrionaceae bacterium]
MRRRRKAKILATLGPASSDAKMIEKLFDAGADVFRLNFSHGTHEEHRERFRIIRQLEKARGRPVGVVQDLQGPKLRIGRLQDGEVRLERGQSFRLDLEDKPGDSSRAPLPHPEVFKALEKGAHVLLD